MSLPAIERRTEKDCVYHTVPLFEGSSSVHLFGNAIEVKVPKNAAPSLIVMTKQITLEQARALHVALGRSLDIIGSKQ